MELSEAIKKYYELSNVAGDFYSEQEIRKQLEQAAKDFQAKAKEAVKGYITSYYYDRNAWTTYPQIQIHDTQITFFREGMDGDADDTEVFDCHVIIDPVKAEAFLKGLKAEAQAEHNKKVKQEIQEAESKIYHAQQALNRLKAEQPEAV